MLAEDFRRAEYERLYAEYRAIRRTLEVARDRRVGDAELRYLSDRLELLGEQLRAWQRPA